MTKDEIWEDVIKEAVQYEGTHSDIEILTLIFSSKYLIATRNNSISKTENNQSFIMAKQPTLPLYYNDIARTCSTWTDEEFGCYMRLLMEQWDKGFIPNDFQRLTRLATSVEKNWDLIKPKFKETDGVLKNDKMEEIRAKMISHSEKQKKNVSIRYQNSTKPPTKNLPLEDEDEDEDEIENSHSVFSLRLLSKKGELDKEAIEISTRTILTEELLKQFNANLINSNVKHSHFSEYKKHLVNWIPKKPKANGNITENKQDRKIGRISQSTAKDFLNRRDNQRDSQDDNGGKGNSEEGTNLHRA